MTQVSYYEPKKGTPGALAMVIALHAAGITALAMWKIDIPKYVPPVTKVWTIPIPKDPDPLPPEPKAKTVEPTKPLIEVPYTPPPVVTFPVEPSHPTEFAGPVLPPAQPYSGSGSIEGPALPP